jgi:glycosyltransferase involved in cell wall biosynthesis
MKISACMIVKDEERVLARCLKSFRGAWDELIVVDTGSKDRTAHIAAEHGARFQPFAACNDRDGKMRDFSLARNAAIDLASGGWILWMDADDVLQDGGADRLRRHAQKDKHAGLQITIRWGRDSWLQTRLFKNEPRNRFVGRIHEYPSIHGSLGTDRETVVDHLPDKTGKESSGERNLRMCAVEVKEDPSNLRAIFYYGNALRLAGRYDEALLRYTQYLALGGNFHCERYMAAQYIACCQFYKREWMDAMFAGYHALRIDPRYAETHCLIGDCYAELGDHAFAMQWYRSAIACGGPPGDASLFVDREKYDAYPKERVRICEEKLAGGGKKERG